MRWILTTAALGALFLLHAPAADAKLCFRIDAPPGARTGATVNVRVTTLEPTTWDGTRPVGLRPARASIRLKLFVSGPRGIRREVGLRRTKDPAVWTTRLRLEQPGRWTLTIVGWEYAPRGCAPAARIRVRRG
jgi:hypothetical protein